MVDTECLREIDAQALASFTALGRDDDSAIQTA